MVDIEKRSKEIVDAKFAHAKKHGGKYPVKLRKFRRILFKDLERSPTDIAFEVYKCKDRLVAGQIASQNLKKLQMTMEDMLERLGLTDLKDAEVLEELRQAEVSKEYLHRGKIIQGEGHPDNVTRLKALELTLRLKNKLSSGTGQEGKGGDINITLNQQINQISTDQETGDIIRDFTNKLSEANRPERKI